MTPLQRAALRRFAVQGYESASLSQITSDLGIKAPSIYAHFKNKNELFLSLMQPTVDRELSYFREALTDTANPRQVLYGILAAIATRFATSSHLKFFVKVSFLPPAALREQTKPYTDFYMDQVENLFQDFFRAAAPGCLPPETLAAAYIGIIDSLQAELLYGGQKKFKQRLDALWAVFETNLTRSIS